VAAAAAVAVAVSVVAGREAMATGKAQVGAVVIATVGATVVLVANPSIVITIIVMNKDQWV
jgi:hypothetical protein